MLVQADSALAPFPDKTFHCVTTSPPYWGLRRYSGEQGRGMFPDLGLEPTFQEFIHNMVMIFREVRRVLRDDGVVWINLGDCFAGTGGENANAGLGSGDRSGLYRSNPRKTKIQQGNLMMMPHRVAIALQDDGWIVRNDVVWWKRNPMPESQTGWFFKAETGELKRGSFRHTRAHEYIFQLCKNRKGGMKYWANQEAVREGLHPDTIKRESYGWNAAFVGRHTHPKEKRPHSDDHENFSNPSGRNPRSVMDVPTAPYKGAHYATFPPNLIAPLIRATCPRWACPVCGQGWSPVVEKGEPQQHPDVWSSKSPHQFNAEDNTYDENPTLKSVRQINVKEYRPTCEHPHTKDEAVPGIVLDPFLGSGTTVMVANELLRRAVGVDISMQYLDEQAKVRTGIGSPSKQFDGLPMFD